MATQKLCTKCGTVADPKTYTKGSIWIEIALWLLFCAPGIIYSIWRLASRYKGCPACGASGIISTSSPVAQATPHPTVPAPPVVAAAVTKKCPFCAEVIQAEAIKCRFCGERLG